MFFHAAPQGDDGRQFGLMCLPLARLWSDAGQWFCGDPVGGLQLLCGAAQAMVFLRLASLAVALHSIGLDRSEVVDRYNRWFGVVASA